MRGHRQCHKESHQPEQRRRTRPSSQMHCQERDADLAQGGSDGGFVALEAIDLFPAAPPERAQGTMRIGRAVSSGVLGPSRSSTTCMPPRVFSCLV